MVLKRAYAPIDVEEHQKDAYEPEFGRLPLRVPIDARCYVCGEELGVGLPILSLVSLPKELLRLLRLFLFLCLFLLFLLFTLTISHFLELQGALDHHRTAFTGLSHWSLLLDEAMFLTLDPIVDKGSEGSLALGLYIAANDTFHHG